MCVRRGSSTNTHTHWISSYWIKIDQADDWESTNFCSQGLSLSFHLEIFALRCIGCDGFAFADRNIRYDLHWRQFHARVIIQIETDGRL